MYDATSQKWVNGAGGGGGLVVHVTLSDGVFYADHTAGEIIAAADTGAVISIIQTSDGIRIGLLGTIENYLDDPHPEAIFTFAVMATGDEMVLSAVSADDYPSFDPNSGS